MTPNLISFRIFCGGIEEVYEAEEGMTWEDFVSNDKYNSQGNFTLSGSDVEYYTNSSDKVLNPVKVKSDDEIINNHTYYIYTDSYVYKS